VQAAQRQAAAEVASLAAAADAAQVCLERDAGVKVAAMSMKLQELGTKVGWLRDLGGRLGWKAGVGVRLLLWSDRMIPFHHPPSP
jgi:hypothetical protein